jgi:hypothetical protein
VLPAEIPGVQLESDFVSDVVETPAAPSEADRATAARANANLFNYSQDEEIAGVDYTAAAVTDDEESHTESTDDDDGSVEFIGENLDTHVPADPNAIVDVDIEENEENEANDDGSFNGGTNDAMAGEQPALEDEDDVDSVAAVRRRSTRIRKKRTGMVVDFDNLAYSLADGVLHINPNVMAEAKEDLKITSENIFGGKISMRVPSTAGVSQRALREVTGLPDPVPMSGDPLIEDHLMMHIVGVVLAQQYSVNKGIQLFGDAARESVKKELRQLHDYATYVPVNARELTPEQKKEALASLIFITQKRCGRIKSRACVNGSTQRTYIPKENTASPTVMNDSVMITSAIDAHEERVIKTMDIPGAFLHADLDEEVIMLLRGQLADLMVQVDPELYGPYLTKTKKGESILYVKMLKAMYGLLRSALLFYLKLVGDLKDYGFELNPYDPCVANKMVDGHQMTVVWHVDDLKVSHKSEAVVDGLIAYLKGKYGDRLVVHDGDVHDYLGVDHDYSEKGVVKMSMMGHLEKIFQDFPEDIGKTSSSPASEHLFQVRDPAETEKLGKFLSKEKAQQFHHAVAQTLFVSTRVRRDVQTVVAFLTTRVKRPDEDDWGKLKRLLKYLKGTKHMKLTLSVDTLSVIRWWVDASYNVHEDCRGHTGAMMSLGRGAPISFSRKQKLNVRSSCEGKLVGIDDALPLILWARYFIEAQGYTVEENILYQDNKSTILLANNGRWSSGKRTKHIRSRYFYIKDKVESGEVSIQHRGTKEMWSDVLTKPKQGLGMRQDRAELMNCPVDYDDEVERRNTHPKLLAKLEGAVDSEQVSKPTNDESQRPIIGRRSVLVDVHKSKKMSRVTWNTSHRVDRSNDKARERHVELVIARLLRDESVMASVARARGRE